MFFFCITKTALYILLYFFVLEFGHLHALNQIIFLWGFLDLFLKFSDLGEDNRRRCVFGAAGDKPCEIFT